MKIGILGVGVIGSAIINGLCLNGDDEHQLFISPRSESLSIALQEEYSQVTRCESNQDVVNQSDLVIISILPQIGLEIISSLEFREEQHVINLMSDKKLDMIEHAIGKTKTLVHMVPLSFISKREGPIAIFPNNEFIATLFSKMGHIVQVDDVKKIESIAAITGLMTSYYRLLHDISNWGGDNHLTLDESKDYTTYFFEALSKHARDNDLSSLATEMTPGGLNEMALHHIEDKTCFKPWIEILDPIVNRLNNK